MKLVVLQSGESHSADARLVNLAHFFGIGCEIVTLEKGVDQHVAYLDGAISNKDACVVINPDAIRTWTDGALPEGLISYLRSHFPRLLVLGGTPDPFCNDLISQLSHGHIHSLRPIAEYGQPYQIAAVSRDICGAFSGLSFGLADPVDDRVLSLDAGDAELRNLISVGNGSLMAVMRDAETEIIFVASNRIADLNERIGNAPLSEYFSRFVPYVMAIRHIFGRECWHPGEHHASIIIDDPPLRQSYGYLNFESLRLLMDHCNFSTTIAFIPHNYRRNSERTVQMFRENPSRFGLCFHGNDHTAAEFASTDTARLNTMLRIAEGRIGSLRRTTGLECGKVMVFPQGNFSTAAMEVLKGRNFLAAVNTVPHPTGFPVPLTLGELAQPAVMRYGGFPLFLRRPIQETRSQDVAFNLFFGKPVLIVEHHDVFQRPAALAEIASMINALEPGIKWSDLETTVMNSSLRRRRPDGTWHVRAFSGGVRVNNDENSSRRFLVEWAHSDHSPPVERILHDSDPIDTFEIDESGIRLSAELAPASSAVFSVLYRNDFASLGKLGFKWDAKAVLRRRLSEVRDNYLSKNRQAMALAKALQRHLSSK